VTADTATLPAGAELDALVAERVMGWQWVTFAPAYRPNDPWSILVSPQQAADLIEAGATAGKGARERPNCPRYSTDWNAMRLVVEAMRARGYLVDVASSSGEGWWATCWPPDRRQRICRYGDTAPHAIALAAFAAVARETAQEVGE
jgi:hypothetical protein